MSPNDDGWTPWVISSPTAFVHPDARRHRIWRHGIVQVNGRRARASDIRDLVFLDHVHDLSGALGPGQEPVRWVMVWELADRWRLPTKVVRAKGRRLERRGLVEGCWCGCRGDVELTPAGAALLGVPYAPVGHRRHR